MSRGSSNGAKHAHATSGSSAFIASTVNTYIAGIGTSSTTTNHHSSSNSSNSSSALANGAPPHSATSARAADAQQHSPLSSDRRKCANPFCNAPLESAFATYCVQKAHCQLYRGLLLHCGSFASERERKIDDAIEKFRRTKRRRLRRITDTASDDEDSDDADVEDADDAMSATFSIPKRKVPAASPTSSVTSNGKERRSESTAQRKLRLRLEQAAGSSTTSSTAKASTSSGTPATPTSKKRRLVQDPTPTSERTSASQSAAAPPPVRTTAAARTPAVIAAPAPSAPAPPAPAAKVGGIEVIPLGAGRHPSSFGGGSRYVQSGNRAVSPGSSSLRGLHPLARLPLANKPVMLPPEPPAVAPLPPAPATVSSARDPRRIDTSSSTSSDALPVASVSHQDAGPAPKRTISASEYLSSRKPQDPRVRASSNGFGVEAPSASVGLQRSASDLSSATASSAFHSAAPRERTLHRSLSDPPVAATAAAAPVRSRSRSRSRDRTDQQQQNRSYASYDSAYSRREYESPRPRAYSPERYSHSHQQQHSDHHHSHHYAYEPEYRYAATAAAVSSSSSSAYPQQAPPPSLASEPPKWSRMSDDSVRPHSRSPSREHHHHHHHTPSVSAPLPSSSSRSKLIDLTQPSTPTTPTRRDASGHPEIAPVAFSSHDWFVIDLLSRFASFFPTALSPVLNKTKKPRKMRFYLDYVQRVKDLSGARLDIHITSGKATVTADSRVWLALSGSSTVELYTQVLETLLEQSVAWRKLLEDATRVYGNGVQTLGSRANHSDAFVRMWQGMKYNTWERFPLERQVRYFRGDTRHHWSFCVGNVEIGAGSHEEKREAYRLGAENAMKFLLRLEILSDSRKYARVTRPERPKRSLTDASEPATAASARPASRQEDAAPRSASSSTSEQTAARPAPAPASTRTGGASDPRVRSTRSTTPVSAPVAPRAPAPTSGAEILIDTPDVTVSRPRDDSIGSPADGAFSPPAASDQSANGGDDMEISDGGTSASRCVVQ